MKLASIERERVRNIVLLSFDSLRSDYVADLKAAEAPHFCLMRDQGVFFPNTIVQAPFTVPSYASMLTGLYPAKTGVRDMHHQLSPDLTTIFHIVKEQGFHALSLGSTRVVKNWVYQKIDRNLPISPKRFARAVAGMRGSRLFAFAHYWDTHTPYETKIPVTRPLDVLLNVLRPLDRFKDTNNRALRKILWYPWLLRVKRIRSLMKEGTQGITSAIKKGYKDSIVTADRFVGGILSAVKKIGKADDTLFILTGDHGDSFDEHNEVRTAIGTRYEHGQFLYDNILRVPLIFYCPRGIARKVYSEQAQLIDVVPTALEALNVSYNGLDGSSLWRAVTGTTPPPDRRFTYSEVVRESIDMELRCVRSMSSKLILDYKSGNYEFYDLKRDPEETNNLWPADTCFEKDELLSALKSFAEMESSAKSPDPGSDDETIKQTLRNLGYL